MKGTNEILLNEATMIEVVQQWLDSQLISTAPVVKSVKPDDRSNYCTTFKVVLDGDADRSPRTSTGDAT